MLQRAVYRTFWRLSAIDHWVRRRFTPGGRLLLGALSGAAVLGLDTNQTVAYQAFTFLLALLVLALMTSLRFRARVTARRLLPRFATAGAPVAYRVILGNQEGRPLAGLVLLEDLADPRPSLDEFRHGDVPAEAGDNWWDRLIGYARWQVLVDARRGAVVEPQPLPTLAPRGEVEVRVELTPARRGALRFTGMTVARPDPLGVFQAFRRLPLAQSLLVLPRRYPVAPIRLPGVRKFQPGGVALATSVGDSEEFASLRDYRPGDPLRRIHWRSWARAGRPVVREYQDEFFVRHALVLDTFARPEQGERLEAAVSVAASLACAFDTGEALLDLMFVGSEAYCFTAGRGLAHVEQMLEVLAGVGPCRSQSFATLDRLVASRAAALSGCLAVLLDWDAPRQAFVRQLEGLGVPSLVLLVSDGGDPPVGAGTELVRVKQLRVGQLAEGLVAL
jgi:uncharacterized protein (DUF58 family)